MSAEAQCVGSLVDVEFGVARMTNIITHTTKHIDEVVITCLD